MQDLKKTVDSDKIREKLHNFLASHNFKSPTDWASLMGIGVSTLLKFLHGSRKARRKTMITIVQFIEDYEQKEESVNRVRISVDNDDEVSMQINPED